MCSYSAQFTTQFTCCATPIINVYRTAVSHTMKIKHKHLCLLTFLPPAASGTPQTPPWTCLCRFLFFTIVVFITSSGETRQRLIHEEHHSSV